MLKKWMTLFFVCLTFLFSAPVLAEEPELPDPDWQVVASEEAGHTWDLDRSTIMKRGDGRVAGFRERMPDQSYKLTLALFMPDRRMAPIMKLSVTADHQVTERWRAEKEEWTAIEAGTPLDQVYAAVWKAEVTQTLAPKK